MKLLNLHHSSIKLPTFCHSDRSRSASNGAAEEPADSCSWTLSNYNCQAIPRGGASVNQTRRKRNSAVSFLFGTRGYLYHRALGRRKDICLEKIPKRR